MIKELLEQILAELKIMNARTEQVMLEATKQKQTSEVTLNNLFSLMPEQMKQAFTGGK